MDTERWREHSLDSDWEAAAYLPFPVQRAAGELLAVRAGLTTSPLWISAALQWVELLSSTFENSRRMVDAWQAGCRDQQNAFLDGLRDQLQRERSRIESMREKNDGSRQDQRATAVNL